METWAALTKARTELKESRELMDDPEYREMAQEEHDALSTQVEALQPKLRLPSSRSVRGARHSD